MKKCKLKHLVLALMVTSVIASPMSMPAFAKDAYGQQPAANASQSEENTGEDAGEDIDSQGNDRENPGEAENTYKEESLQGDSKPKAEKQTGPEVTGAQYIPDGNEKGLLLEGLTTSSDKNYIDIRSHRNRCYKVDRYKYILLRLRMT